MYTEAVNTVLKYSMISPGDRVCAAVSGGADSVALVFFLQKYREHIPFELSCCHLNHMLRGGESERDEEFTRRLCRKLGLPLIVQRTDVAEYARAHSLGTEEAARDCRYEFFGEISERDNTKIALAHTLSDSAETVLFNLARGTGIKGVCGISPMRGCIIRPLIAVTRAQTEAYCRENRSDWVTDSSNLSDIYNRNKIRLRAVPVFKEINPEFEHVVGAFSARAAELDGWVTELSLRALEEISLGNGEYLREKFLLLPAPVAARTAEMIFSEAGVVFGSKIYALARETLQKSAGRLQIGKNMFLSADGPRFYIRPAPKPAEISDREYILDLRLKSGEICTQSNKTVRFNLIEYEQIKNFDSNTSDILKNSVDCDKIVGIAVLRHRKPGDRFSHPGRRVSKTLKKFWNEDALSPERRAEIWLLADDAGVVWTECYGPAARAVPGPETEHFLEIKICDNTGKKEEE